MPLEFRGKHREFIHDKTLERDLEGSLSCGKTTVALWAELEALKWNPGIWIFLARWTTDATRTLLQSAFEQIARLHGTEWTWNSDENSYEFANGSRAFSFGLKTQSSDPLERYGKIRGLAVSRIYVDQAEQIPEDIASELRFRLRPDIEARSKGQTFPRQLTLTPNPVNTGHWIDTQFPIHNRVKGRKYWALSLYDNRHNLPDEFIEQMERTYPPEHPKHRTMILGQRGPNVIGEAIYEHLFDRELHAKKPIAIDPTRPLVEAFEFGRHNPCWMLAQRTHHGGLMFIGGVMGMRLVLEDFLPIVKRYREEWALGRPIETCTSPMGETVNGSGRHTLVNLLREAGFRAVWRSNANAPDVRLAMIETMATLLRRRTMNREESIAINPDPTRWLQSLNDGSTSPVPFLAYAFEGGYVWSDHVVSVGSKPVRQPHADDEYANAMRCVENIVLNFCIGKGTDAERDARENIIQPSRPIASSPHAWMA